MATASPAFQRIAARAKEIPLERLVEILSAADELPKIIARSSKPAAWELLMQRFRSLLRADQSAFFLVPVSHPTILALKARYPAARLSETTHEPSAELFSVLGNREEIAWATTAFSEGQDQLEVDIQKEHFAESVC